VLAARTGTYLPVEFGGPDMPEFAAEPGDSASLVIERSLLAWPTPFEINFVGMGGTATTWERVLQAAMGQGIGCPALHVVGGRTAL
jgi:hypothetical protein